MKRTGSFILAMCLSVGMLAGCGGEEKTAKGQQEVQEEAQSEEATQEISFGGYSFAIPESWEEGDSTENTLYFYPETGMLMIQFSSIEGESILDEAVQEEFTKGFSASYENFELVDESIIPVAGGEAYQQVMNLTSNDTNYQSTMVTYDCQGGWMTFAMFAVQDGDTYSQEFERILDSIQNESGAVSQADSNQIDEEKVLEVVEVKAVPTLDGLMCVFITNNSQTIVDELDIQINYKDETGTTIDMDEDGHDMVLPGSTVVSRLEAPESYSDYEIVKNIELGVNTNYENHASEVAVTSNQGDHCIIVEITNNSQVTINEIEYIAVLYSGDQIVTVEYPEDIMDVNAGEKITDKVDTFDTEYDRFEIYLNQAHTFGY